MARQFPETQAIKEKDSIDDGLTQMRSSMTAWRAKLTDFEKLNTKWAADNKTYPKADTDRLAGILSALGQFTAAVDSFLASGLGK